MREELVTRIECPIKLEGCSGLSVSASGSGIELEQTTGGYVVRTREGQEAFGNCGNYEQCYGWLIKQTRNSRKPAEIKSYSKIKK